MRKIMRVRVQKNRGTDFDWILTVRFAATQLR